MAESNLKEMMIDDIAEEGNGESMQVENANNNQITWYMINSYGTFNKVWEFIITLLIIYDHFAVPVLLVFPDVYQTKLPDGTFITEPNSR